METNLNFNFGYLFEKELLEEIQKFGVQKEVSEGYEIIDIGNYIKFMPLILKGAIKILREDNEGNELLLYFLERGDTCAMTLTCCLGQSKSEIRAIAETDVEFLMIPVQKMDEWMGKYKSWQNFILQSYNDRFKEMLEAVDTIAFHNMDERLLKHLKDKAMVNHNDVIHTTHQEIANDLNTSRVVISRLLKKLENLNEIELHRNHITIKNI